MRCSDAYDPLLAYLDGEMSIARMRVVRNHLRICWQCRAALAELEAQIEAISHLLSARTKVDTDRSIKANEKFMQWRNAFEAQRRLGFEFLPPQMLGNEMFIIFALRRPVMLMCLLA